MPLLLALLTCLPAHATPPPLQHGVVFFIPPTADEAVSQLQAIKADGFNLVKLASWVWTVPTEGSDLRKTVLAILDWCDKNGMAVWLLHNIQWGSPGEGGDVEEALDGVTAKARDTLVPWAQVLQGHPCVAGILLGNEVSPGGRELFKDHPRFLAAFRQWLQERHGDVAALNARWGTKFASLGDVQPPAEGEPGAVDVARFCRRQFASFYNAIAAQVLKPVLGNSVRYGSKGGASPYILSQMPGYSVCSWDDLLANWPLWKTKLLVDTTGLPVFNSELHLYHDTYAFGPSPELSRCRYFTSGMLGEWMTASFAWGQWKKPEIAQVHAATPGILADLRKVEPVLRALNTQPPAFEVLVTEATEEGVEGHPPLELAYASAAATGLPWRFVCDLALARQPGNPVGPAVPLLVDSAWLTEETAQSLADLCATRCVVFVGRVPTRDEYGHPLPEETVKRLRRDAQVIRDWSGLAGVVHVAELPPQYRELVDVPYLWWSPERGHYHFPVKYPHLEARRAEVDGRRYVVIVNHTQEPVTAPVAFVAETDNLTDLLTGKAVDPSQVTLGPFGVLVLQAK